MIKYYAGVGSRETPPTVITQMKAIGTMAALSGFVLRSGAADGADSAFEQGCRIVNGPCDIYLPWSFYNKHLSHLTTVSEHAKEIACYFHPMGRYLKDSHQLLHGRNAYQVLGIDLATPAEFVVCYTPDGAESIKQCTQRTGGTATAIKIASACDIPVYNLAKANRFKAVVDSITAAIV